MIVSFSAGMPLFEWFW